MPGAGSRRLGVVNECAALLRGGTTGGSTAEILATLDRLKSVRVTPNVLRKTEVGKLINSKALLHHADLTVRQRSSALVASWRAIVKDSTTARGPSSPPGKRVSPGRQAAPAGGDAAPAAASGSAAAGEPAARRRRLSPAPPSRANSVTGSQSVRAAPLPALLAGAGPQVAPAQPITYEGRDPSRTPAPSGPTPGPVPRSAAEGKSANRYAPELTGAAASPGAASSGRKVVSKAAGSGGHGGGAAAGPALQAPGDAAGSGGSRRVSVVAIPDEETAPVPSFSSGSGAGLASSGPPPGSSARESKAQSKHPRVSLVSALLESVPYPTERPGSGGRKNGKGYFCYENFHTGNCSRGESCPFPHYSGEGGG